MKSTTITIFIHGTLPPTAVLKIPLVYNFFYCPQGLAKAKDMHPQYNAHKIAQLLHNSDPQNYDVELFYTFGWSGDLSTQARKKAAKSLFDEIIALKALYSIKYEQHTMRLRIIAHSHGGNVALHLADIHAATTQQDTQQQLSIDELILLAVPVQKETDNRIADPLFQQVYALYSDTDLLQVIDPQGITRLLTHLKQDGLELTITQLKEIGPLFSTRHFSPSPHLIQINVKYKLRSLFHIDFLLPRFIKHLPHLIKCAQSSVFKATLQKEKNSYIIDESNNNDL